MIGRKTSWPFSLAVGFATLLAVSLSSAPLKAQPPTEQPQLPYLGYPPTILFSWSEWAGLNVYGLFNDTVPSSVDQLEEEGWLLYRLPGLNSTVDEVEPKLWEYSVAQVTGLDGSSQPFSAVIQTPSYSKSKWVEKGSPSPKTFGTVNGKPVRLRPCQAWELKESSGLSETQWQTLGRLLAYKAQIKLAYYAYFIGKEPKVVPWAEVRSYLLAKGVIFNDQGITLPDGRPLTIGEEPGNALRIAYLGQTDTLYFEPAVDFQIPECFKSDFVWKNPVSPFIAVP